MDEEDQLGGDPAKVDKISAENDKNEEKYTVRMATGVEK